MSSEPLLRAQRGAVISYQWGIDAKNRIRLFLCQVGYRADVVLSQLTPDFFSEPTHFLVQGSVAELQIMIIHQIFDVPYREGNPDSDADCTDREQFYSHFDTYRAMR